MALNQYSRMLSQSLKLANPKLLRRLKRNNKLSQFLRETEERAEERHLDLLHSLQRDNPPPEDDPQTKMRHLKRLEMVAEELVLHEVIYPAIEENDLE